MTTSSIGNSVIPARFLHHKDQKAFTFIEVMMTLAILTGGVVMLYKAFFLCLDYQNHLAFRLKAFNILENRIALTEQMLRDYKLLSFTRDAQQETAVINGQEIVYRVDIKLSPTAETSFLYQVDISVAWQEKKREVVISRSAYISNLTAVRNT